MFFLLVCETVCTSDKLISQRIQGVKHAARTRLKSVFRVYIFLYRHSTEIVKQQQRLRCVENSIFFIFSAFHFHVCIGWKTSYDCMPSRSTVGGATIVPNVCLRCEERRNVNETKYIIHVRSNETSLAEAWAGFSSIWTQHRVEQWTIYDDNIDSLFFTTLNSSAAFEESSKKWECFFCCFATATICRLAADFLVHNRERWVHTCERDDNFCFLYFFFLPLPISHDVSLLTMWMHTMLQQPSFWIKSECGMQSAGNFLCNNLDSIFTGFFLLVSWSTRSSMKINRAFNLKFELNWAAHVVDFKSHQRFAENTKHSVLAYLHQTKKCRPYTLIIVINEKEHWEILSEIMSHPLTATTNKRLCTYTQNSHAANHLQIAPVRLNYLRYRVWFVDLMCDNPPADFQKICALSLGRRWTSTTIKSFDVRWAENKELRQLSVGLMSSAITIK